MNDFVSSATGSCCDEQHRVSTKRLEWCPRRAVQRGESGFLMGPLWGFCGSPPSIFQTRESPELKRQGGCRRHQPYRTELALVWMDSGAPTGTGGCAAFAAA